MNGPGVGFEVHNNRPKEETTAHPIYPEQLPVFAWPLHTWLPNLFADQAVQTKQIPAPCPQVKWNNQWNIQELISAFLVGERERTDGFTEHQPGRLVVVWFVRCVHSSLNAECGLYSAIARAGPPQGRSRGHCGFRFVERTLKERSFGRSWRTKGEALGLTEVCDHCIWVPSLNRTYIIGLMRWLGG